MSTRKTIALVGAAAGLTAGVVAERLVVRRRRTRDPEAHEEFGTRRGERSRKLELPDGARIFIEELGPGDAKSAVVFVHGSALRTDMLHYQMDAFPGRRLIFIDMRGHGLSQPIGSAEYTMKRLAQDLDAVVEDCGLDEVVLVGHSVGGMVALQYARDHSDLLGTRVKGVVLANTTYRPPIETIAGGAALAHFERFTRRPFEALRPHSHRVDSLRKIIRPSDAVFWTVSFSAFAPHASAKQVDFTYDMVADTPSETLFGLFKAYRSYDVTEHLGDIAVPILIVTGKHDRICLSEASEHMAVELPKAQLEVFDECGHMTMLEAHNRFNSVLEKFLTDTLGPS